MIASKNYDASQSLTSQAAKAADHALSATQHVASDALNGLANAAQELRHDAAPLLHRAADSASHYAHQGMDAVRHGTQQLRERAQRASDGTVSYIKEEPIKAVLIAAATGAALMALASLWSRVRA